MCESRQRELRDAAPCLPGKGPGARVCLRTRRHAPAAACERRDVHEDAALHRDFQYPRRRTPERSSSRDGAGLRLHPRVDGRASPTRVAGCASSRSIRPACRREDRESRPTFAHGRLAHPLLPRHAVACPQGPRPGSDLERECREPPDGRSHRERPLPSQELGAREGDDPRPEPALLGTAHRLPRADRPPLLPVLPAAPNPYPVLCSRV